MDDRLRRIEELSLNLIEAILEDPTNEKWNACVESAKMARFCAKEKFDSKQQITVNILTSEALLEAKRKAGMLPAQPREIKGEIITQAHGEKREPNQAQQTKKTSIKARNQDKT